ncbi:hypothetical protein ULG90_02640 [Halopseudomonas pachastrellae]|nr:hypothetical protein ULG90_02640 [Halopseudomonas pachastrellae]
MSDAQHQIHRHLPEHAQLEQLLHQAARHLRVSTPLHVPVNGLSIPVRVIELGSRSPQAPVIGFFGGVHGVERIGTQVLISCCTVWYIGSTGMISCVSNWSGSGCCSCR